MTRSSDAEHFERLANGSRAEARAALTALYEDHAADVRRFLGRLLDPNDVEDLVQETFLTAVRRARSFRSGSARPWLLALAARRARDELRRARRARDREQRAVRDRQAWLDEHEPVHDVASALQSLAARHRTVIELRFIQELSHAHVAEVLGVSLRTAKQWSADALSALQARLEEERG